MKIPLSVIHSFLQPNLSPSQIGEVLTLLGIEVDHIHNELPPFARVVVGEVLFAERHPNAKHLQIAQVSDGAQTHTVVCGAPNCRAGIKTAFAQLGAVLPGLTIEKTTIRGIESNGMLCSGAELHLSKMGEGILEFPSDFQTGADLIPLLWDPIFELSFTPNLGHCMSALGIARELSAALQIPLTLPKAHLPELPLSKQISIADFQLCSRYLCRLIEDIQITPSPFWLKTQLEACGQKSINQVVDVTNYVMMKFGHPLHAFDYDLLAGDKLEVKPAEESFRFLGLDGVERNVPKGALVIFDAEKPVAIAGIIGSADSAVNEKTTRILLESACFEPTSIRKTAKQISLRTESAQRFEKGTDPNGARLALSEACALIGGTLRGGVDIKNGPIAPKQISYRTDRINQLIGTKLSTTEIEEIFTRLELNPFNNQVTIPTYRNDLHEEIDLVEEVARIYGYNHIEKKPPQCTPSQIPNDPQFVFENEWRNALLGSGLTEFLCCDLISPKLAEIAQTITPASMGFLKSTYSKSEEYSILRTSLLPGLLQVTQKNIDQKNLTLAAFEIGRIHFLQNGSPMEIPMSAVLLTGKALPAHWSRKPADFDYYDLKGIIEQQVSATFIPSQHMAFHPGRQADIHSKGQIIGSLGEIHPSLLDRFDIQQRVFYAELNLLHLLELNKAAACVTPLPQFPSSQRDWTVPLDSTVLIDSLFQAIRSIQSPLLETVELIDLYQPEGALQKHATFRFTYRDRLKTISFEEVEKEHAAMLKLLAK